jgi:hypothetical protein
MHVAHRRLVVFARTVHGAAVVPHHKATHYKITHHKITHWEVTRHEVTRHEVTHHAVTELPAVRSDELALRGGFHRVAQPDAPHWVERASRRRKPRQRNAEAAVALRTPWRVPLIGRFGIIRRIARKSSQIPAAARAVTERQ